MSQSGFAKALNEQIAYEFGAAQQYIAVAVYYDSETLPRLSAHFHRQALEERNHAMMMVQYLLDAGRRGHHPGRGGTAHDVRRHGRAGRAGACSRSEMSPPRSTPWRASPAMPATMRASSSCSGSSRSRWRRCRACPTC